MFTSDGYINYQHLTDAIPYGRMDSSDNGCGWIAAYNILHHMGDTPASPRSVADSLLGGLLLWGYLGTWPLTIVKFLRRCGYLVRWSLRRCVLKERVKNSQASILLYVGPLWRLHDFHMHYVMLYPRGDRVRILNFQGEHHWETIENLDALLPPGMLTLLITVDRRA
jgi:hypothetical protein